MRYGALAIYMMIGLAVLACGCDAIDQNVLASGKYVALYEEINDNGALAAGEVPFPGMAGIPTPFYYHKSSYYPENYPPWGTHSDYPPINESLKILLGENTFIDSPERLQPFLMVYGVYNLPYSDESGLSIIGVDRDGTVHMVCDNQSVILKPGSTWASPTVSTRSETSSGTFENKSYSYTINYTTTLAITNLGVYDK